MSKRKLPKDEQELLDAVEAGEYDSVLTESRKEELQVAASETRFRALAASDDPKRGLELLDKLDAAAGDS